MDLIVLQRLTEELDARLRGRRISQVYALPKNDVALVVDRRTDPRLWFSAEPDQPHLYARSGQHGTPKRPPAFAMAARKLLGGRRVASIACSPDDRVVVLQCGAESPRLVFETIPRRATALLVDSNGTVRAVWQPRRGRPAPGEPYCPPPRDTRETVGEISRQQWMKLAALPDAAALSRGLLQSVVGMSPLVSREIVSRYQGGEDLRDAVRAEQHRSVTEAPAPRVYSPAPLERLDTLPERGEFLLAPYALRYVESRDRNLHVTPFESLAEAADVFYPLRASLAALDTARGALDTRLRIGIAKVERTLDAVSEDVERAGDADRYRRMADLLLACPNAERGDGVTRVLDHYAGSTPIDVPVDDSLSLIDNAQVYYRRARRAERSRTRTQERRRELADRIETLRGLLSAAEATRDRAEQLRLARQAKALGVAIPTSTWTPPEAPVHVDVGASAVSTSPDPSIMGAHAGREESGVVAKDHSPASGIGRGGTERAGAPESGRARSLGAGVNRYRSSDGFEILVGRSAAANERITHKLARPHDFWLHAEGPGSHVVIRNPGRGDKPSETALREAASLAAYFSRARGATKANVHWTQAKHVKKPRGGPKGQVVLRRSMTVLAEPLAPESVLGGADEP